MFVDTNKLKPGVLLLGYELLPESFEQVRITDWRYGNNLFENKVFYFKDYKPKN